MNITLYKKHNFGETAPRFTADIYNTFWITPIQDASGFFSNWNEYTQISNEELEQLKYDLNSATISISNEEIINAYGMFANNKLIRKVEIDFPNVTNIGVMFQNSSIEEIECDFSSVNENNGGAFANCGKLKTVRCDFRNLEKRVMGAGAAVGDTDGLDRYGYGFSFNASPNLTTCECNFASLKNADNLLNKCSNLTTFNCELDSLETAKQMCPNAKLTAESVKNIADKIKTHTDGETHIIDIGLNCTDETFASDFRHHVESIIDKGWYPVTHPVKIDNENIKHITKRNSVQVNGTYTNNFEWSQYRNGMQGEKYGFAMGTDKTSFYNQITLTTHVNLSTPIRIFLQIHDQDKKIISKSQVVELNIQGEYEFNFDTPFEMEKEKTYFIQFFEENNTSRRAKVYLRCSVLSEGQYAYGVLHASEINNWEQQWYGEWDGDYSNPHQLNAQCKFKLVNNIVNTTEQIEGTMTIPQTMNVTTENATITTENLFQFTSSQELTDSISVKIESKNPLSVKNIQIDRETNIISASIEQTNNTNVGNFYLIILYLNNDEIIHKDYILYTI